MVSTERTLNNNGTVRLLDSREINDIKSNKRNVIMGTIPITHKKLDNVREEKRAIIILKNIALCLVLT